MPRGGLAGYPSFVELDSPVPIGDHERGGAERPPCDYLIPLTRPVMLKHQLIHPQISAVLAQAGHHAKVLIADGNYPASTKRGPRAELVCLNLMPGVVTCRQVLEAVLSAVPGDAVHAMMYTPDDPYTLVGDSSRMDSRGDLAVFRMWR